MPAPAQSCDRDIDGVPSCELTRDLAYQDGYMAGYARGAKVLGEPTLAPAADLDPAEHLGPGGRALYEAAAAVAPVAIPHDSNAYFSRIIAKQDVTISALRAVAEAAEAFADGNLRHSGACCTFDVGGRMVVTDASCRCEPDVRALRAAIVALKGGER